MKLLIILFLFSFFSAFCSPSDFTLRLGMKLVGIKAVRVARISASAPSPQCVFKKRLGRRETGNSSGPSQGEEKLDEILDLSHLITVVPLRQAVKDTQELLRLHCWAVVLFPLASSHVHLVPGSLEESQGVREVLRGPGGLNNGGDVDLVFDKLEEGEPRLVNCHGNMPIKSKADLRKETVSIQLVEFAFCFERNVDEV